MSIILVISAVSLAYAASSSQSKLAHLVVAVRVTRTYLPEPMEAREREITTTIRSLSTHSPAFQNAVKARLLASYTFLSVLRPLMLIYADLSCLFFIQRPKPARLNERLNSAISNLRLGVPAILNKVKDAYKSLPEWTAEVDAQFSDVARKVVAHVGNVNAVMNNLFRKQNLRNIFSARGQLLMDPIITLVENIEMHSMNNQVSGKPPLQVLHAMTERLGSDKQASRLWSWSVHYFTQQMVFEINVLTAADKNAYDLVRSLRSNVFITALLGEYASRITRCPIFDWRTGSFPGDKERLERFGESVLRGRAASQDQNRVVEKWIAFLSGIFNKSLKMNKQDRVDMSGLVKELYRVAKARVEAERDIMVCREDFMNQGLKYLE